MIKKIVFINLFCIFSIYAAEISAVVTKIYDGDTILVKEINGEGKFKIRLADIDAPEKRQRFGNEVTCQLNKLLFRKQVIIKYSSIDRYGRIIGEVYLNNVNINEMMLKNGWCWWYKNYSKKYHYQNFQNHARKNKLGIWKNADNIPPWIYRKNNKRKYK